MRYRKFGNTGLEVSEISIGTEWLYKKSPSEISNVLKKAIKYGVNYFDVIFNFDYFLQEIATAIKGHREEIILSHHIGSHEGKPGKYMKTRSINQCIKNFEKYLSIMKTDYVDIGFIHFVLNKKQYDECFKPNGIKDLTLRLKVEGKIKHIGMSTHDLEVAIEAANSGIIEVIMIPINIANKAFPKRNEFLKICAKKGVGVIAMKPFVGGHIFLKNRSVSSSTYRIFGKTSKDKLLFENITPIKCLHYILSQVGISTIVPGVASIKELEESMVYYSASDEEKDYSGILKDFQKYESGICVYCNHCQPCSADIDIGIVNRLLDIAKIEKTEKVQKEYDDLDVKASECTECGDCLERCPFDVKVIDRIHEAVKMFE